METGDYQGSLDVKSFGSCRFLPDLKNAQAKDQEYIEIILNNTYIEFIVEIEHCFIQNICSYFLENILIWVQYLVTLNAGQEMKKSCYDDRRKFSFFPCQIIGYGV